MEKHEFKILFLDDEMFSKEDPVNPATIAWEELKDNGYNVQVTDKMSEVINAYYKDYFHLYILDIDMGKVEDSFEGNGATVGEVLRRMSSISNVIVYSARGKVNDWIKVANYHFNEYVHKEWGELKLLEAVDNVFNKSAQKIIKIPSFKKNEYEDFAAVCLQKNTKSHEFVQKYLENVQFFQFNEIAGCLEKRKPKVIVIMIEKLEFDTIDEIEENLHELIVFQPSPNVVLCINLIDDKQILKLVNTRPFRLLNLSSATFEKEFQEALDKALFWYGEEEIFDFPEENQLIRKPMTAEEIAALKPEEWESTYVEEDDSYFDNGERNE